jgi:hypothetical protein
MPCLLRQYICDLLCMDLVTATVAETQSLVIMLVASKRREKLRPVCTMWAAISHKQGKLPPTEHLAWHDNHWSRKARRDSAGTVLATPGTNMCCSNVTYNMRVLSITRRCPSYGNQGPTTLSASNMTAEATVAQLQQGCKHEHSHTLVQYPYHAVGWDTVLLQSSRHQAEYVLLSLHTPADSSSAAVPCILAHEPGITTPSC